MAANVMYMGTGAEDITFARPIRHITINVETAAISISLDGGTTFMNIPTGFYTFPVGPCNAINITGAGSWQLIAIQA